MATDPTVTFMELMRDNWDPTQVVDRNGNQVLANGTVTFHTGWYDRAGDLPAVTVSSKSESPITSGQTGFYGTDLQTGLGMQLIGGGISINFVAGSYPNDSGDDLWGIGPTGQNPNPKNVRWAMAQHGRQLLIDNQRELGFRSVAPGSYTDIEDSDEGPTVYRTELRVIYVYEHTPSATA